MRKIGIMGGTFNPIHLAHLILAEGAFEEFNLDKVLIMPSNNPPHKQKDYIVCDEHRVSMIRLAISNNPHFELSKIELEREGLTYTADTLKDLTMKHQKDEFYFIMGADSLYYIEQWKNPDSIFKLCHIIAAGRDHLSEQKMTDQINYLTEKYHAQIHYLHVPNMDISSNTLRENIKDGKSIRYYIPDTVEQYIKEHQLYQ